MSPGVLGTADEVFLTSSLREIAPVTRVGDRPVGSGQPGPIARQVFAAYRDGGGRCHRRRNGRRRLIIESIITTLDGQGAINFAPMGVEWGEDVIVVKPFLETTTFRNIQATGAAVVNLTDNVFLFAQAAISNPQYPAVPATVVRGAVLECRVLVARDRSAVHRRHTAAVENRDRVVHHGNAAGVPRFQSRPERGARDRDPVDAAPSDPSCRDRDGSREIADHRKQDRWAAGIRSDGVLTDFIRTSRVHPPDPRAG